ncbi:MAG: DHH family phosphoesterase [Nanoarchaeota archaeon]|nr:DHH family phosphoesterase [Nanoarchaeota archaeon]
MKKEIVYASKLFLEKTKSKQIKIISHFDTDGITSAAIIARTLKKLDKRFSVKIVKNLENEFIKKLNTKEVLLFLDLGSGSLEELEKLENSVFIIDHHEITGNAGENTTIINPHLFDEEEISASGLSYLFSKALDSKNKELANLAVVGMVGDMLGKEISKLNNEIIEDAKIIIKKGLLIYPATRPIHKALEYSSSIFIPGVTGNFKGVFNLLKESGIEKENGKYKSLIELEETELSKLITSILMRTKQKTEDVIGNIYLIKLSNRIEDARELSAMINACSRLNKSEISLSLCLENKNARKKAESIYVKYKQHLISALNYAEQNKIEGKGYVIINAKNQIKDTMIGTVASILSMSREYKEGTVIIGTSYDHEKIKVSARISGRNGRNVRELLSESMKTIHGECGGHQKAAGCLVPKSQENQFMEILKKQLEVEVVKI